MKKPLVKLLTIALIILGTFSWASAQNRETRDIGDFKELSLGISAELVLSQDNKTSLVIEGDPSTIEHIETEISGGRLKIKYDKWSWKNYKKVVIYLSTPSIEGIAVSGSGHIVAKTSIESGDMNLAVSGSGKIQIKDLQADKISAKISGSGDIYVASTKMSQALSCSISGSGDIDATGLEAGSVTVRISGSGGARVYASENLEASVSGSGDVYYKGNPQVNARVSGSGKVRTIK